MAEVNVIAAAPSRSHTRANYPSCFEFGYSLIANIAQSGMRVKPTEMVTFCSAINQLEPDTCIEIHLRTFNDIRALAAK